MMKQQSPARLRKLNKVLGTLSLVGWSFFIVALYMYHYAAPNPDNFYDQILDSSVKTTWNATYADMFMFFMSVGVLVTLVALTLNVYLYRMHRTHIWINLILLLLAGCGILLYFVRAISS
ncbi:hypothetical protein CWE12_01720 [Aliidiomarina sedimenti]|uniref:DUF1634 domain-containing protein n=1 Tax=Aliidiomarina sedimenti TaxID=1933879 RepID=A0ABY0C260_9GAMM|nr:hypothetical protein [Aliidiomarina sedimenti]RUO31744.1 hypothetical protein CWE12_01720 [Aliidiomarina sedimenti]